MFNKKCECAIFDLDGVITKTAKVHSKAWKRMFNEFLQSRAKDKNEDFKEFTYKNDYLPYVDGKPRYEGVESFLQSRDIELPYGNPDDSPQKETICGLGNRKNDLLEEIIKTEGVDVYPSTLKLIQELKAKNVKIGVASSSKNCKLVLKSAGIHYLFETVVDGIVSEKENLKGKPAPDIFITAANRLNAKINRTIVVEDAISGVKAGQNGNFGLVIGVGREDNMQSLQIHGADWVVNDLDEITIEKIETWFTKGIVEDGWKLEYFDYNPKKESTRESLLTIGNGFFGTRGAFNEFKANPPHHYPGTYIAGVYNKLTSHIEGKDETNEDFVNCPNWIECSFKIDDNDWFNLTAFEIESIHRTLHFKNGLLEKEMIVVNKNQQRIKVITQRFASMQDHHLAALRYKIIPLNFSGKVTLRTSLDGNIKNRGVERYNDLRNDHLECKKIGGSKDLAWIVSETKTSKIKICEVAKMKIFLNEDIQKKRVEHVISEAEVKSIVSFDLQENDTLELVKLVAIDKKDGCSVDTIFQSTKEQCVMIPPYVEMQAESNENWQNLWKLMDLNMEGNRIVQKLLRLHSFHLIVTASRHNMEFDASIPARGLHGEAYRGHIFWDELYIIPFYCLHFPKIALALLLYRYRRLNAARQLAQEMGYQGAMYPWQSSRKGLEETQKIHLNPRSGEWIADYSRYQRHVSLAIAYNTWTYYWITNDYIFLEEYGGEMLIEICKFWADKSEFNKDTKRYDINNVMGPDEFHEKYPDSTEPGFKNNAYTNIMVAWLFRTTLAWFYKLDRSDQELFFKELDIEAKDLDHWEDISKNLSLEINKEGIIAQFAGYFDLKTIDLNEYRQRYENIYRMDRILHAEGKNPDHYQVAKQADTLMAFYNLGAKGVKEILKYMGYSPVDNLLEVNYDYYLARTSHGSTLSRVVHSHLAFLLNRKKEAYKLYHEALNSDFQDIQGGTTGEGIHTGVMASTVTLAFRSYAGFRFRSEVLKLNPQLPFSWENLTFHIKYRHKEFDFKIEADEVSVKLTSTHKPAEIIIRGEKYLLNPDQMIKLKLLKNAPDKVLNTVSSSES